MKIIEKSIKIAKSLQNEQQFQVSAYLYSGRQLLAIGQNSMTVTSNKAFYFGNRFNVKKFKDYPYPHAEIDAISKLWGKYKITSKDKLVVVRLNKNGNPVLAKPCDNCKIILNALSIKKIFWTIDGGWECCLDGF